jgi:hypothetical protein
MRVLIVSAFEHVLEERAWDSAAWSGAENAMCLKIWYLHVYCWRDNDISAVRQSIRILVPYGSSMLACNIIKRFVWPVSQWLLVNSIFNIRILQY